MRRRWSEDGGHTLVILTVRKQRRVAFTTATTATTAKTKRVRTQGSATVAAHTNSCTMNGIRECLNRECENSNTCKTSWPTMACTPADWERVIANGSRAAPAHRGANARVW